MLSTDDGSELLVIGLSKNKLTNISQPQPNDHLPKIAQLIVMPPKQLCSVPTGERSDVFGIRRQDILWG